MYITLNLAFTFTAVILLPSVYPWTGRSIGPQPHRWSIQAPPKQSQELSSRRPNIRDGLLGGARAQQDSSVFRFNTAEAAKAGTGQSVACLPGRRSTACLEADRLPALLLELQSDGLDALAVDVSVGLSDARR